MCGQNASSSAGLATARGAHLIEKLLQIVWPACHRRRAKRGDAVAREEAGDMGDDIPAVQSVEASHTVDVHVDESGDDEAIGRVNDRGAGGCYCD
jgi:hypothetical protein